MKEMKNKKMTMMGIGHKVGVFVGIYLVVTVVVSRMASPMFRITEGRYRSLLIAGIVLAVIGFSVNMVAAMQMMKAFKGGRLATKGLYAVFLNPMYTMQLLVTLPGIALLFNSWLVLTVVLFALVMAKIFIREEEGYLEEKFGDQYRDYRRKALIKLI